MTTWHDFYYSDLQSLWALLVAPFAFLIYHGLRRATADSAESRFLASYVVIWGLLTMLDPIATGPVVRALGFSDTQVGTAVMFAFVLLGDLRVFALLFGLAAQSSSSAAAQTWQGRALGFSLIVPIATGLLYGTLRWLIPNLPGVTMWLIYEAGFFGMAIWLARRGIPKLVGVERAELRSTLSSCAAYVGAYYALWFACDIATLAGVDEGWAVRAVPNQLYYALWIPFVYWRSSALRGSVR